MAKVFFAPTINFMSGRIGEGVYTITGKGGMSYLRHYTYPTITQNNHEKGAILANLSKRWNTEVGADYKKELKTYAIEYHALANYGKARSDRTYSAFAIFISILWKVKAADPTHIMLDSVVMSDLRIVFPNQLSIAEQVAAGWIPATPKSSTYLAAW